MSLWSWIRPLFGKADGAASVAAREALLDDAAEVFDTAILRLDGEQADLVAGVGRLTACALALGAETADPAGVLAALRQGGGETAAALEALIQRGESLSLEAQGPDGLVRVTGRTSGALAWLSLALAAPAGPAIGVGRAALDAYPHPAWILSATGEIVTANRAWLEAVEAPDLSAALKAHLTLDTEAHDLALAAMASGRRGERTKSLQLKGGRRAMKIWAEPLAGGGAAVWTADITDARSATRAARLQSEALDLMLAQIADAVAVFDEDRRLARHNSAFANLWGLEPAWLAERPRHGEWLDRLRQDRRLPAGEDYGAFKARELARHEQAEASEAIWRLPEGRTLRVGGAPHPEGGVILVFSDITDELRVKTQFNHLLQVQQATLDKLTDAVAVFGADARLKLHNEAFQSLWALPAPALAHEPHFDDLVEICATRLHDLQFWRDLKGRIADPDPALRAPAAGDVVTGDGRRLAWQSRPLPDGATLVGFADVTDARRIEEALRDRQGALDEAERLKREFVGAVSRELRTPLTTILGYAELLDQDEQGLEGPVRDRVGAIRSAAAVLARSIDDILDIAELDAGEVRLARADLDVDAFLAAALKRWGPRAHDGGVDMSLAQDETAGRIRADPRKLAKVVDHLIDHAVSRTPKGGSVHLAAARGEGEVSLKVSDTGQVIPYFIQARLFDRYAHDDSGATRLSLALVKGIVELHGGWVTVESGPGLGATFTCHLPEDSASDGA
jgi:signal transduction histidine kinase